MSRASRVLAEVYSTYEAKADSKGFVEVQDAGHYSRAFTIIEAAGRAKKGGEYAEINKSHYKGGQFLPSTEAPPGTFKQPKGPPATGRQLIEPGVIADPPSPRHSSIYNPIREYVQPKGAGREYLNVPYAQRHEAKARGARWDPDKRSWYMDHPGEPGKIELKPNLNAFFNTGEPVTAESKMGRHTIGELIDRFNKGERWVSDEDASESRARRVINEAKRSWTYKERYTQVFDTEEEARAVSKDLFGEEHSKTPYAAMPNREGGWMVFNREGTKRLAVPTNER